MSRAGVRPDVAERVLGHVIGGVEGVYDRHSYTGRKGRRLAQIGGANREHRRSTGKCGAAAEDCLVNLLVIMNEDEVVDQIERWFDLIEQKMSTEAAHQELREGICRQG